MEHCAHCPTPESARPCKAVAWPHPRFCELTDPSHPDHAEDYVRSLSGEPPPAVSPPTPPPAVSPPPQPPSLLAKAVNFAGAVASHVAAGLPKLDAGGVAARLAVCSGCDQRLPGGGCAGCGCNLAVKASWADQDCPMGRWPTPPRADPAAVRPG